MEVVLIVVAVVCFAAAALAPERPQFRWVPIGLVFLALAHIAERLAD